jgi:hypothetical protein
MGTRQDVPTRSLFREVNDRVAELGRGSDISVADAETILNLICECGSSSCARRIEMTVSEYENVRKDEALSLFALAHEGALAGRVIVHGERYIVAKGTEDSSENASLENRAP